MPREKVRNVTEIRTRGRKGGINIDDSSPPPQKKAKTAVPVKVAQRMDHKGVTKKNPVIVNVDLKIERIEDIDKKPTKGEGLSKSEGKRDNLKESRKRKVIVTKDEGMEDIEVKAKNKNKTSKMPLRKKGKSESSSEKEDSAKEAESKTSATDKKKGNQEMGLRSSKNTRQSESFSSDGEKEVGKRNSPGIHTSKELNKHGGKTAHKNKSMKETESCSSYREKSVGQQHATDISTDESGKHGMQSTRKTRNMKLTENLSSDMESNLKQQDTTDTSTDNELAQENERKVSRTKNTKQVELLCSGGEKDVKQQPALDTSTDDDLVQQKAVRGRVTRYARRTESLSSDGERDLKQSNTTDSSTDNDQIQKKVTAARRTRNTRQSENLSLDERDKQLSTTDSSTDSRLVQKVKCTSKTRNTRRTESMSSDRETDTEQKLNTETSEVEMRAVKCTRETRNTRRSGSFSSDWDKDQSEDNFLKDTGMNKRGKKNAKSKTTAHSESFSSDMENDINPIININQENKVAEALNDADEENVNKEKDANAKFSMPRTRRAKRIEESFCDKESGKVEKDKISQNEHAMELNKNEDEASKNEVNLPKTKQSKQDNSNSDGEDNKNEDRIWSDDDAIKMSTDIETDIELEEKSEEAFSVMDKSRVARNPTESYSQVSNDSSDEIDNEGNKSAIEHRNKNVRKLKDAAKNHPPGKEGEELSNLEVVNKEKDPVRRVGQKPKSINKGDHETSLFDTDSKEFSDRGTDNEERKKEASVTSMKTRNASKGKNTTFQQDKESQEFEQNSKGKRSKKVNIEHKTRNASRKGAVLMERNESLQDDTADDTMATQIFGTTSAEIHTINKITAGKKILATRTPESCEGSGMEIRGDEISDKIEVCDSSITGILEISVESRTSPIDIHQESISQHLMTFEVHAPSKIEDLEQSRSLPLSSRGRKQRGRVAKVQFGGKMTTRGIKKLTEDWKENVKSSETNDTKVDKVFEDLSRLEEIAGPSFDTSEKDIQLCKVVINKLDLNDPLICKQMSDYDLNMLKVSQENYKPSSKSSGVGYQISIDEFCETANEPWDITNEMATSNTEKDTTVAFEIESNKTEQIDFATCLPDKITKDSFEIASSKNVHLSLSTGNDSYNRNEITFESAAEKASFDSIVDKYVAENVSMGNVGTESKFFLSGNNSINPSTSEESCRFEENSDNDQNITQEENIELNINYQDDQESENTEIDGSENFSESIINLDLKTQTDRNDSVLNLSSSVFSKDDPKTPSDSSITNEPVINDSKVIDEAIDEISEDDELLVIEDENLSEEEPEIAFHNLKTTGECKGIENFASLESTCENVDVVERNEKLDECAEKSSISFLSENESLEVAQNITTESVNESEGKNYIEDNFNQNCMYDSSNTDVQIVLNVCNKVTEDPKKGVHNLKEDSIVERKENKSCCSETSEDNQSKILSTKEDSTLPNFDENKLAEINADPSRDTFDKFQKSNQNVLGNEESETIDSNLDGGERFKIVGLGTNNIDVDKNKEFEEGSLHDENIQSEINIVVNSVGVYNVDQDPVYSEKEDVIENVNVSEECNEDITCDIEKHEVSYEKEKNRSPSTSVRAQENPTVEGSNSEDSLNHNSNMKECNEGAEKQVYENSHVIANLDESLNENSTALEEANKGVENGSEQINETSAAGINSDQSLSVLEKINEGIENVLKQVNENTEKPVIVCHDSTKESSAEGNIPVTSEAKKRKTDLNLKVQTNLTSDCDEKNKAVEHFGAFKKTNDLKDGMKCIKKKKVIHQQSGSDSAVHNNPEFCNVPNELKKTDCVPKHVQSPTEISSDGDHSQPGPSANNSAPKRSSLKQRNPEIKVTSASRWPRMPCAPVRMYLKQFVPLLLEGLLDLDSVRPSNPIQYLANWMEENKEEAYYKMKENNLKLFKERIVSHPNGRKRGR